MKPLNDRVLVKRLESEEKTAGGLFIPDAAKEKPSKGEIVACGPGKMTENGVRAAMEVKVGDVVLFSKYAGTEIKVNGADHIIMREDDILAILDYKVRCGMPVAQFGTPASGTALSRTRVAYAASKSRLLPASGGAA